MLNPLEAAYRSQLAAVRARVVAIVEQAYSQDIDDAAILDSFDAFAERVAPTIAAGQDAAQSLTLAFLASLAASEGVEFDPIPDPDIPGTNYQGKPLREAMGAIGGTILQAIGNGANTRDAIGIGQTHLNEFADNEVRGAADREQERQNERPEVTGWRGVVSGGGCERCQVNAGTHSLDEPIYRHPGCDCERVPVFGA